MITVRNNIKNAHTHKREGLGTDTENNVRKDY